ncbi:hypothetical protein GCM10027570_39120 [Streptomonospora sediminis]
MSSGSTSTPYGVPHASHWAEPPEFYLGANIAGRSIRRCLVDLGYVVHTPAELYGSIESADGRSDEDWLARISPYGWAVIGKDEKILQRPHELAAYRAAKVHMFLLPNNVKRDVLIEILHTNPKEMCVNATGRVPGVWRLRRHSMEPL